MLFLVPGILVGVAALVPVFSLVTALQWWIMDTAFVAASGGAAAGAMLGSIVGSTRLGAVVWDARRPSLCRRLAEAHRVPRDEVEALAQMFSSS